MNEQSLKNLRPFQPGQSGNPTGRQKRKPVTEALLAELAKPQGRQDKTRLQAAVANLVTMMIRGRGKEAVEAFKLVMSYTDGVPVQVVELDIYDVARSEAEKRGLDPDKVVSILDALRTRRAG